MRLVRRIVFVICGFVHFFCSSIFFPAIAPETTHIWSTLCVIFSLFFQLCCFSAVLVATSSLQLNSYVLLARIIVIFLSIFFRSYNFLIVPAMRSLMFPYLCWPFSSYSRSISPVKMKCSTNQKIYLRWALSLSIWCVCSMSVVCLVL